MGVTSELSDDKKTLTIKVSGHFNISLYEEFSSSYKDKIDAAEKFVIDLTGADYMDSSAIGMILMLRERAGGENADITIKNPIPDVKRVLEIANLQRLFKIE